MIAPRTRNYVLVSGSCLLLNNAVLMVMDHTGAPLPASVALSFTICVVVGYVLHSRFSFCHALGLATLARYAVSMSFSVPLAFAALWLWRDLAGQRIELAAPLATVSMTLVNFALCRYAVFGRREASRSWVHS